MLCQTTWTLSIIETLHNIMLQNASDVFTKLKQKMK